MLRTLDRQETECIDLLATLNQSEKDCVIKSLNQFKISTALPLNSLAVAIAGREFSEEEKLILEMKTLFRYFQRRRKLIKSAFTAPQVGQILDTSRQTPHDRVASQNLLAIKEDGKYLFPSWQFDASGANGVIDGLPDVIKSLNMSDYAKLNWFTRSNPYLDGAIPYEALKAGQKDRVIAEASAAGSVKW